MILDNNPIVRRKFPRRNPAEISTRLVEIRNSTYNRAEMIELGVNIDHVATIRQARRTYEPDPVWAAAEAELGGADGITMHLREDRRHIQDHDVETVAGMCHVKLNLEMAATDAMITI